MSVVVEMPKRGPGRPRGLAKSGGRQKGVGNLVSTQTKATTKSLLDRRGPALVQRAVNMALGLKMRVGPAAGPNPVYAYPSESTQAKMLELCLRKLLPDLKSEELSGPGGKDLFPADEEASPRHTARAMLAAMVDEARAASDGDDESGDAGLSALLGGDGADGDDPGAFGEGIGPSGVQDSEGPDYPHEHSSRKISRKFPGDADGHHVADLGSPSSGSAAPLSSGDDSFPRRLGLAGRGNVAGLAVGERPPDLPAGWRIEEGQIFGTNGQTTFIVIGPDGQQRGRKFTRADAVVLARKFAADEAANSPVRRAASDQPATEVGERELVGSGWIECRRIDGDGREQWCVVSGHEQILGFHWGRDAARAEAERLRI